MTRERGRAPAETQPIPISRSVYRKVVSERAAVIAADASQEVASSESLLGAQIRSTLAVPLWRGEEILGVLQMDNRRDLGMFTAGDLELVGAMAHNASLAVANARLVRRLRAAEERLKKENAFLKGREESRRTGGRGGEREILGRSAAMRSVAKQIDKVVDTKVTVLVEGETGVGKELVAAAIHYRSRRRDKLFIGQNCAAVPENLLESELFGHKRGSFTGAHEDKKGLFELADGGTLFLDEVGEMPLDHPVEAAARAAGGRDPPGRRDRRAQGGRAHRRRHQPQPRARGRRGALPRGPLLPPARLSAARAAAARAARRHRAPRRALPPPLRPGARALARGFSQQTMELLQTYDWPGNVRELQNEVQRLVIQVEPDAFVTPELLSPRLRRIEVTMDRVRPSAGTLKERMDELERWLLIEALRGHQNNKTATAKSLGHHPRRAAQKTARLRAVKPPQASMKGSRPKVLREAELPTWMS